VFVKAILWPPIGDEQIEAILASTKAFADSYDDMNFTPPYLGKITARTLIVQGDRDPLYPVEISVEMTRAIPQSSLWIVPKAGHGLCSENGGRSF
jgi:pimeloyl-ACP methyl ester carboxylesterase